MIPGAERGQLGPSDADATEGRPAPPADSAGSSELPALRAVLLGLLAVASFHLAFLIGPLFWLMLVYLGCLFGLRRVATARQAFYFGLAVGLGVFVPQMGFLWGIFGPAAIPLWLILAFFHGLFLLPLNRVEVRLGTHWAVWLAPVLWCGVEYFRSESWWLRFAWFTAGSAITERMSAWSVVPGVYGWGFLAFSAASLWLGLPKARKALIALAVGAVVLALPQLTKNYRSERVKVAGIQLEFPGPPEVLVALDRLAKTHPEAELLLLSEYTFDGPVPDSVKAWCKRNRKWLVAGGKEPAGAQESGGAGEPKGLRSLVPLLPFSAARSADRFYNTAFVISTNGEVVFTQAKSVPIQFFKDGEPARGQRVWDSPWGKVGIAICYDVSYRRVMDELILQGAKALLIPTMDVESWGEHEHRLNARMACLRGAEYNVPVFRVASSGISQILNSQGSEVATAPFPGPGAMIAGELRLAHGRGKLPVDHWLAPICTGLTGLVMIWLGVLGWRGRHAV